MKKNTRLISITIISIFLLLSCGGRDFKYKKQKLTYQDLDYELNVKYLNLDNYGKIAYVDEGMGNTTLFLVHGVGTYIKHWLYQINELKKKYRVVAVDMPGYGKTGYSSGVNYTTIYHGKAMAAVIKKLGLKNVILIGHSYGGNVVVEMSDYSGLNIIGMIMIAPQGLQKLNRHDIQYYDNNLRGMLKYDFSIKANINTWFDYLISKQTKITDNYLRELLGLIYSGAYRDTVKVRTQVLMFQQRKRYNNVLISKFQRFNKPNMLIIGKDDRIVPGFAPSQMRAPRPSEYFSLFCNTNSKCKLKLISGCGHMVPIELPNTVNSLIKKFANALETVK